MSRNSLVSVRLPREGLGSELAWAAGKAFRLPASLVPSSSSPIDPNTLRATPQSVADLRLAAAFTEKPPASSRLPISYRWVPGQVRSLMASGLGRALRWREEQWAEFPGWPLDLSADLLADCAGLARPVGPTPVVLTHDLDSPEGVRNLPRFLEAEEQAGATSTSFVVPCGYRLDHGVLRDARARGHGLGVHGYDHGNRTPFLGPAEREERLSAARDLVERYDARGYRAPSLLRTRSLLRDLNRHFAWDSSIPTSGGPFPVPNNGCASARPFRVEGMAELPISLPRDGSLRFLGYGPEEIGDLWIALTQEVAASGGVVVLLTHCERRFSGGPRMMRAYRNLLAFVRRSPELTWSTPEQALARWQLSASDPGCA